MSDRFRELKNQIIKSSDISESPKAPVPKLDPDRNYVFISYARADYKAVYCELIELYRNHVRFVYDDALTAGEYWRDEVKEKILESKTQNLIQINDCPLRGVA